MNPRSYFSFILIAGLCFNSICARESSVDRDEYFRRMEIRALELSKKMAELTGTTPIQLIQPKPKQQTNLSSGNSAKEIPEKTPDPINVDTSSDLRRAQNSYDALPGPVDQNKTITSRQYEDTVDDVSLIVEQNTEELKGSYFLRPSFILQSPFESDVKGQDSLDGKVGNGVGVVVGRRIENWTMSARFGYTNQEFTNPNFASQGFSASGDVESISLTGNLGIAIPLTKRLSFETSFGLGYSAVSHSLDLQIIGLSGQPGRLFAGSDGGFSYELSLLLDYLVSERLSAFLGYRLAGIPGNNALSNFSFDSVNAHLFELGFGLNF